MTTGVLEKSQYYTVTHADQFPLDWRAFYDRADELTERARGGLESKLDIPYGSDPYQHLDVYGPAGAKEGAAVFVFFHGGGFREGSRRHYGFVAEPLAAEGIVTVVPSYRLTPAARYPSQAEDARAVLGWIGRHIAEHGGDAGRIYVGGHSAGAILAAFVGTRTSWLAEAGLPRDVVKGIVPISGPYDLIDPKLLPDYVADPGMRREASPLYGIDEPSPRAVIAVGSREPYLESSRQLAARLTEEGVTPRLIVLDEMDHDDTALALGDERGELVRAIVELVKQEER